MHDVPAASVREPPRLGADGAFSYTCHRCRRCCSGKRIRVNPYEVYRLARRLGMTTTRFIERHTVNGGTELAVRDDLTCVFLDEQGCGVHGDRPLVCRLYPLGRLVASGEPDRYFLLESHPQSEGVFGSSGTVAEYLEQQGAAPFLAAADRYFVLLERAGDVLSEIAPPGTELAAMDDSVSSPDEWAVEAPGSPWMDIDAVLAAERGAADPAAPDIPARLGAEDAMTLHITVLDRWHTELRDSLARSGDTPSSYDTSDHFSGDIA